MICQVDELDFLSVLGLTRAPPVTSAAGNKANPPLIPFISDPARLLLARKKYPQICCLLVVYYRQKVLFYGEGGLKYRLTWQLSHFTEIVFPGKVAVCHGLG